MSAPYEAFILALDAAGANPRADRSGHVFLCPVHGETNPSAHASEGHSVPVVARCHACGASYAEIAEAIGADVAMGSTEYEYADAEGRTVAIRYRKGSGKGKRMGWLGPEGSPGKPEGVGPLLYRLPELLAAPEQEWVFIVEGEKDVETLRHMGFTATTPGSAAEPWRPEWNRYVAGHPVVLLPDQDDPGQDFSRRIAGALSSIPSVKIVDLPVGEGEDLTDWVKAGGTAAALRKMVEQEPEWDPLADEEESITLEDSQLAERWVHWTTGDVHYVAEADATGRPWLHWNGTHWEPETPYWAERSVYTFAVWFKERANTEPRSKVRKEMEMAHRKMSRNGLQRSILRSSLGIPGVLVRTLDMDADLNLFGVRNGVVDLRSGRLLPPDRSRLITKSARAAYSPNAEAPIWTAFLETVFQGDKDLIRYVQKAVGYTLTGLQSEQAFFMPYGSAQNGKSRFIEAVKWMMGDYGGTAETKLIMTVRERGVPDDLHALVGKRLVAATETQEGKHIDVARLKWITGEEEISSRPLYGKLVTYEPTYKLWLTTNHLPSADASDPAYWRRVRVIPFAYTIPEEYKDAGLPEKLKGEAAGILRWAVEGAALWRREGLEPMPATVVKATTDYRSSQDVVGLFLDEMTEQDSTGVVPMKDLYAAFTEWYITTHPGRGRAFVPEQRAFGNALDAKGFPASKGAKGIRVRKGLVLLRS